MDPQEKSLILRDILQRMEAGEITSAQATAALIEAGADPAEAEELVMIAEGGSDVIEMEEPSES